VNPVYSGDVPCGSCARPLVASEAAVEELRCTCGTRQQVLRFRPFRETARAASAPVGLEAAGTPCAYHAGNAASSACSRCGSFVCSLCATPAAGATWCPPCFERQRRQLPGLRTYVPTPHRVALALGLVSLLLPWIAPLTAPLALWQASRAWRTRDELEQRERFVTLRTVVGTLSACASLALCAYLGWLLFRSEP
jgi:hypothetical protein